MGALLDRARLQVINRGQRGPIVELLQTLLYARGAELVIDGRFGNYTEIAVRAFQAREGIHIDGVVGAETAAFLEEKAADDMFGLPPAPSASVVVGAPWLSTQRAITGEKEYPGEANSPFILSMAKVIGDRFPEMKAYCAGYTKDAIAWCGLDQGYCFAVNGIRPPFVKGDDLKSFLWADAWKRFGDHCDPRVGAVAVFTRAGGGHVSMIEGIAGDRLIVRGGNQSDMINVTSISMDKLTDTRWPTGWPVVDLPGLTTNAAPAGSTR